MWFSDYGVWAETSHDGKRLSKEESVSGFIVVVIIIIIISFIASVRPKCIGAVRSEP